MPGLSARVGSQRRKRASAGSLVAGSSLRSSRTRTGPDILSRSHLHQISAAPSAVFMGTSHTSNQIRPNSGNSGQIWCRWCSSIEGRGTDEWRVREREWGHLHHLHQPAPNRSHGVAFRGRLRSVKDGRQRLGSVALGSGRGGELMRSKLHAHWCAACSSWSPCMGLDTRSSYRCLLHDRCVACGGLTLEECADIVE